MSRYENSLTTLQARSILFYIEKNAPAMVNRYDIEDFTFETVEYLETEYSAFFPVDFDAPKADNPHFSYLAFTFSACARFAIKCGDLPVLEYLSMLADIKEGNEKNFHDLGAFGDLYEILIRCAFIRRFNLVKWYTLTVKDVNTCDLLSKKFGKVEIGHNGKTLTFGTLFDCMYGEYTSIVYGVFDDDDKKEVYRLCREKEYEKALDYVTSYSVYWKSKYQFEKDMNELTRGKGITLKKCGAQVVYNPGKHDAFIDAIESGKFISVFDMLNR